MEELVPILRVPEFERYCNDIHDIQVCHPRARQFLEFSVRIERFKKNLSDLKNDIRKYELKSFTDARYEKVLREITELINKMDILDRVQP